MSLLLLKYSNEVDHIHECIQVMAMPEFLKQCESNLDDSADVLESNQIEYYLLLVALYTLLHFIYYYYQKDLLSKNNNFKLLLFINYK